MKSPSLRTFSAPTLLWRFGGVAVIASMTVPLVGCGSKASAPPPPVTDGPGQMAPQSAPAAKQGMSTGTKLKILAGAAAAYYLYKKYEKSKEGQANAAQNVQYYVSKSTGRVYYRDPKTHQAHFVTPPRDQIQQVQVPADQASTYQGWQGYDGATTGKGLDSVFSVQ